ncbi:MAG: quinol:cytochrome C oxidoreductase [Ignavibacteria bacterium]
MEYQKKEIPEKINKIGWILIAIGLILSVLSCLSDSLRGSYNIIIAFTFLLSISVGSIFLIALEYATNAVWSTPIRRVSEFLAASFPLVIIFAIPLFLNIHNIFSWSRPEVIGSDNVIAHKSPYLNITFFSIRFIAMVVIFYLFYKVFTSNSQKQDISGDQKLTSINVKFSVAFMPVAAVLLALVATDWLMSLSPKWYSTIFGFYFMTGVILAGLSATTFVVVSLNEKGYFTPALTGEHYYSLGALMFAFINFWAYIAFSQFLLIWYANLPEETIWFMARWQGNWKYITIAIIFIRFFIPYFALLSQPAKMNPRRLKIMSIWILFSQIFDLYWIVMPNYSSGIVFSWNEIGFPVLMVGLIILVFYYKAKKINLMPVKDPKLQRGLDFHL